LGVDLYFKAVDEDGLTLRDVTAVGGGFLGGVLTGAIAGSFGGPFVGVPSGILGGAAVAIGIDNLPHFLGDDVRHTVVTTVTTGQNGEVSKQIHSIIRSAWVDGQKVDVLHTTTVTIDVHGKVVGRSQDATPVTNGLQTLDQIRDAYRGNGLIEQCFPASTPITISPTETRPISDIRVGDTVLAFDSAADLGRGALVPSRVVRLYRNTTDEWVKLTWAEGGEAKELVTTPGHHFLDRFGNFPTIEEMLENGRATVVLASGELTEVTAERIIYSAETAHLFEQAQAVGMVAGNAALKPSVIDAWQTYNFEVEDLHTYVAGGVRVHNDSGPGENSSDPDENTTDTWPSRPFHDIRSMAEIEGWGVEGWSVEPWQDAYDQFQYAAPFTTPLVLDLDGDGIELTSVTGATALFDVGVDGFAEATGWVAADDGLLVLDVNGNGRIDNGSELFGDQTGHAHGFLALAQHDDNGDGVIDASDTVFGQLRIWQDLNQDGISQASEMRSLGDVGISSISVQSNTTSYWVAGNEIRYESTFTWDDGRVGVVGDAFFASDKIRTKAILADDFEYHPDVFELPVLAGVGHLAHVASHSSQCRHWL
jgi:hypothetical protein